MRAIVHTVADALARCELTFVARQPIDVAVARAQHTVYCALLRRLGVEVEVVDVSPAHADAVFIEDTFVVLDELAVATAMGAPSRRGEVTAMVPVVARHRRVVTLPADCRLEGGDVLRLGRELFVGRSSRTDDAGIAALHRVVTPCGYRVRAVDVHGCLHLKTAVTAIGGHTLLANPAHVDVRAFQGREIVAVPPAEPTGANALLVGTTICLPASAPQTAERLRHRGLTVTSIDIGELEKAEAGMTCLCLLFADRGAA